MVSATDQLITQFKALGDPVRLRQILLNLLGYAAGFFGGGLLRIDAPMRRALTLEVGMQNAGLGTALAEALER